MDNINPALKEKKKKVNEKFLSILRVNPYT